MAATTIGMLNRTTQAFCAQLCEKQTLEFGIAYYNAQYPQIAELNQYREIVAQGEDQLRAAWDEMNAFFAEQQLSCRRWAPAIDVPAAEHTTFLQDKGFTPRAIVPLILTEWVDLETPDNVRILPGRAMRSALGKTFSGGPQQSAADICHDRMDDPSYDIFVAVIDKAPAGRCALYQVGDVARVMDLTVVPGQVDGPAATALLGGVLALAKRLGMAKVCALVDASDAQRLAWLKSAGFVADGQIIEFDRTEPASAP